MKIKIIGYQKRTAIAAVQDKKNKGEYHIKFVRYRKAADNKYYITLNNKVKRFDKRKIKEVVL